MSCEIIAQYHRYCRPDDCCKVVLECHFSVELTPYPYYTGARVAVFAFVEFPTVQAAADWMGSQQVDIIFPHLPLTVIVVFAQPELMPDAVRMRMYPLMNKLHELMRTVDL